MRRALSIPKLAKRAERRTAALISQMRTSHGILRFFQGKRVVVIGPNTRPSVELDLRLKHCGVCVLINKGYRLSCFSSVRALAEEIVLFHCLDTDESTGGGTIDTAALRQLNIRRVFYPLCEDRFQRNVDAFHASNTGFLRLHRINAADYAGMKACVPGFTPTTGFAAIWIAVNAKAEDVYVTGMSFYRTNYSKEYAPHLDSLNSAIALVERFGNHNPDLEFLWLRSVVENKRVCVDSVLESLVREPYKPLFYSGEQPLNRDLV